MTCEVYDNFLDQEVFSNVQNIMLSADIPWFMNQHIVKPDYKDIDQNYNYQFTHTFYRNHTHCSDFFSDCIDPLFFKINPSSILRVKANLIPRTHETITHQMHVDIGHFKGKTAIFYINTNDGKTIFEDGTEIDSVENRLVVFDSNILHTGTTCTNTRARCLINLNYYTWNVDET